MEIDDLITRFREYLENRGLSKVSVKNYISDVRRFLKWTEKLTRLHLVKGLTANLFSTYRSHLLSAKLPRSSINRKLSSLRRFGEFLKEEKILMENPAGGITNIPKREIPRILTNFANWLQKQRLSPISRKNYLSDISKFLQWVQKTTKWNLSDLPAESITQVIIEYKERLLKYTTLSKRTINRKLSSLRRFSDWAEKTNLIPLDPFKKKKPKLRAIPKKVWAPLKVSLKGLPLYKKIGHHLRYIRPSWYKKYHEIEITRYFHWAILIIFCAALGFGIYDQIIRRARPAPAYPTALTQPKRYLSFQGRLTDSSGNPITTATNFVFKLYNTLTGGNLLWNSGTCSIDPDQDGIFSTILGDTCGSELTSDIFSENVEVWLEITVAGETMDPRQQVATVAYALNAETLQGFPPGTNTSTIPYIDSDGKLTIAAASPTLQSTSGTFGIEGQALSIVTASGSDGNINLAPDGSGVLNLTLSAGTGHVINATDANLGSSGGKEANTLYYGTVSNDNTNVNLLKLESGSTPTPKFTVDAAGNASASGKLISNTGIYTGAGDGTLRINASGIISNSTWQGNVIGLAYGGTNKNLTASTGQVVYTDSDSMELTTGGTTDYVLSYNEGLAPTWTDISPSGGPWTEASGYVYPDNASWHVGIGTVTTSEMDGKFTVSGARTGKALAIFNETGDQDILVASASGSPKFVIANDGSVGIGITEPSGKLQVVGDEVRIGDAGTVDYATADGDLYVEDALEIDGSVYLTDSAAEVVTIAGLIDADGSGTHDIAGTLNLSGNTLSSTGDLTIDPTGGGVKIGTGAPDSVDLAGDDLYVTQDLEVDGTIYPDGGISGYPDGSGTANYLARWIDSDTLGTGATRDDGTNVAIGTAPGTYKFQVAGGNVFLQDITYLGTISTYFDTSGNLQMGGGTISDSSDEVDIDDDLDVSGYLYVGTSDAFQVNTSGQITAATDGTINSIDINAGAVSDVVSLTMTTAGNTWSSGNLTISGTLDVNGPGTHDIAGTLNLSGNTLTSTGDLTIDPTGDQVIFADGDTLNVGGKTGLAYNAFANSADAPDEADISSDNDLYIGGDLEVDGTIYGDVTVSEGEFDFLLVNRAATFSAQIASDIPVKVTNTSDTEVARITNAGYLRLGSAGAPTDTLDVDGTANISGNLDVNNGLDVAGASLTVGGSYSWNTSGQITAATDGTINSIDINAGAVSDVVSLTMTTAGNTWSSGNLTISGTLDVNGPGTHDIAGTLNLSGNTLTSTGDLTIDPTGGGVKIGTGAPDSVDLAGDDLYVTQDLEVDGIIYPDGGISGYPDGSGTANYLARWIDSDTLGTGATRDDGTNVAIGAVPGTYKFQVAGGNVFLQDITYLGTISTYFDTSGALEMGSQNISNVGDITIDGTTTIGDASGDTVTVNSASWTFANDTNFALSGGVNGLSFDTSTLSIDAANDRVGIGRTSPAEELDIAGDATISGTLALGPNVQADAGTCDPSSAGKMYYDGTTNEYYYCNGGSWTEMGAGDGDGGQWTLKEIDGTLYPNNLTTDVLMGGTATASATFRLVQSNGNLDIAGTFTSGTSDAFQIDASGNVTSGTWTATVIDATYGGTGQNSSAWTGVPYVTSGTWSFDANYLATAHGGLGANVTAAGAGEILYSTATTTYGHLAAGTSGQALLSGGVGVPSWGTLGTTYGGTGQNFGSTVQGNILYFSGTGTMAALGPSTSGYVLTTQGAGANPTWSDIQSSGGPWTEASGYVYPDNASWHVGIGTVTTSEMDGKFTVSGARTGKALAIFNETGDQDILVASASGSPKFVIANDGSVGIGITEPSGKLQVVGDEVRIGDAGSISYATADGDLYVEYALEIDGPVYLTDSAAEVVTIAGLIDVNGSGTHDIAGTLNLSGNTLASSGDLTIDPTGGGVKIGTGTPGSIDLAGDDLYVTGDLEVDGIIYGDVTVSEGEFDFLLVNRAATFSAQIASDIPVKVTNTSDTEVARITNAGYLRLGSAGAPTDTLDVDGTANISGNTTIEGNLAINGNTTLGNASGDIVTGNAASWIFANDTNFALPGGVNGLSFDTSTLSIDAANDRVGIGTTGPVVKLEVSGSAKVNDLILGSALTGNYDYIDYDDAGITGLNTVGVFHFQADTALGGSVSSPTAGISVANLYSSGNVGIGTTGPSGKLQVVGDEVRIGDAGTVGYATADGDLYIEDALEVDGPVYLTDSVAEVVTIAGLIDVNGSGTHDIAGTLNLSGNTLASSGDLTIDPTGGGVKIGTGTPDSVDLAGDDLYVTQDLEVDGTIYPDGGISGYPDGSGTANYIVKWQDSDTLTTSVMYDDGTNVGIGTTSPEGKLSVAGSLETNRESVRYYRNLLHYNGSGSITGTAKITMPKSWSNTMMHIRIQGYNYSSNVGAWEVIVSGYNYATTPAWYNYTAEINGSAPFSQVRLAHDGSKNVILLGDTSTAWSYPKIAVSEFVAGHSAQTGWGSGWSISFITDETGIGYVVTPPIRIYLTSGGYVGIGTTSPGAKLDVNGTVLVRSNLGIEGNLYDISQDYLTINDDLKLLGNDILDSGGISRIKLGSTVLIDADLKVDSTLFVNTANNRVGINDITPGYTLDVAGTGRFTSSLYANTELYMGNWIRWSDNDGLYWSNNAWHIYPASSADMRFRSGTNNTALRLDTSEGTARAYLYADTNPSMGFLDAGRGWQWRTHSASGEAGNIWFEDGSWTGNPGSDWGKIEYHSDRIYLAAGSNSNRIVQFRRSGSDKSYIDNEGNHIFQNYGVGMVGTYSSTRYQGVFSMGTAYMLPTDGTSPSNLYGIAWTHTNVGGQSKSGLSHQALFMSNGITQTAIGTGIWTNGNLTVNNIYMSDDTIYDANNVQTNTIYDPEDGTLTVADTLDVDGNLYVNSGYFYGYGNQEALRTTDEWLRLNQAGHFSSGTYSPYKIRADGGLYVSDDERIYRCAEDYVCTDDSFYVVGSGWLRVDGSEGLYFESHGGGWRMTDSTWIRAYNNKSVYTAGEMQAGTVRGNNYVCIGSVCKSSWPSGGIGGSGSTNWMPKWTGSTTLGNSQIYDGGSYLQINTGYNPARLNVATTSNVAAILGLMKVPPSWGVGNSAIAGISGYLTAGYFRTYGTYSNSYGVYAATEAYNGYGFYTPDRIYAGGGYYDLAEAFDVAPGVEGADIVSADPENNSRAIKSSRAYDPTIIGIISTASAMQIGDSEDETPLAIAGRLPCKVSTINGPIHRGDPITSSSIPGVGMKATKAGPIVGKALGEWTSSDPNEIGKIEVFLNVSWYDPDVFLTSTGDIFVNDPETTYDGLLADEPLEAQSEKLKAQIYSVKLKTGEVVERMANFAEVAAAKVKAGLIETQNLIAENVIVEKKIVSPVVETDELRVKGQATHFGDLIIQNAKFEIQDASGSTTVAIDSQGNASFSGEIVAKSARFRELVAEKIKAGSIEGLDEVINQYYYEEATPLRQDFAGQAEEEEATESALLAQLESEIEELQTISYESLATSNLNLDSGIFNEYLAVLGQASIVNLEVTNSLVVNNTMQITDNSVGVVGGDNTLYIQPSGIGMINILAGKFVIDEKGNVEIAGDVHIAGNLEVDKETTISGSLFASLIRPLPEEDLVINLGHANLSESGFGKLLVKGVNEEIVASINAEGEAKFKKISIAAAEASQSGDLMHPAITTNATAGTAILPAGYTEFTVYNNQITDQSLIYITPISDTQNKVLYVKAKKAGGWFKVAIDEATGSDIEFNWWIIN